MPGISVSRIPIPFRKAGINWSSYWATLISATVENAAPTHVVLTFPSAQTSLTDADFTIAGFTISSGSWTGAVLTLVVSRPVLVFDGDLTITFVTTTETATVTNNVADDGNTVAWYDYTDLSTITKDENDRVSVWADKLAGGNDLAQASGTRQPLYQTTGVLFSGEASTNSEWMFTAAFTLNQPITVYWVFKQLSYTSGDMFMGGLNAGDFEFYEAVASGNVYIKSGSTFVANAVVLNEWHIVRMVFNGASSKLSIGSTEVTGNPGSDNAGAISIGARYNGDYAAHFELKEAIFRKVDDADLTEAAIYSYLENKFFFLNEDGLDYDKILMYYTNL